MEDYINIVIFQLNVVLNCNIIFHKFLDKKKIKKITSLWIHNVGDFVFVPKKKFVNFIFST